MIEEMTGDADDFTAKLAHRTFLRYAHIAQYEMRPGTWGSEQKVKTCNFVQKYDIQSVLRK